MDIRGRRGRRPHYGKCRRLGHVACVGLPMGVIRITKCKGCGNRIDPHYCHCGEADEDHGMGLGHAFVPAGCTCGYEKPRVRKVEGYSKQVRERLDDKRPKYSAAVKSLAAFATNEQMLDVLLSHLDGACQEAIDSARERGEVRLRKLPSRYPHPPLFDDDYPF